MGGGDDGAAVGYLTQLLSAVIGSTSEALRAGKYAAASATAVSKPTIAPNVGGSVAETP